VKRRWWAEVYGSFQCEECGQFFYFDLKLEGMEAEPGQRLALACPHCEHRWSFFRPDETDGIQRPSLSKITDRGRGRSSSGAKRIEGLAGDGEHGLHAARSRVENQRTFSS